MCRPFTHQNIVPGTFCFLWTLVQLQYIFLHLKLVLSKLFCYETLWLWYRTEEELCLRLNFAQLNYCTSSVQCTLRSAIVCQREMRNFLHMRRWVPHDWLVCACASNNSRRDGRYAHFMRHNCRVIRPESVGTICHLTLSNYPSLCSSFLSSSNSFHTLITFLLFSFCVFLFWFFLSVITTTCNTFTLLLLN